MAAGEARAIVRIDRRALILAAGVPAVVLLVRVMRSGWLPSGDLALIEYRTRDVGTAHTPLIGVYSRYGWNHPGPLFFYLYSVPYRLLGSASWGILVGALTVNCAAVGCIAVVAWRRGGLSCLALSAAVLCLLVRSMGFDSLVDPWNPFVIALPLLALVYLSWAVLDGDRWALPVLVGVGSFVVQTHVGTTVVVGTLVILTAGFVIWSGRARRFSAARSPVLLAALVGLVCWTPPIVQQFRAGGGNLGQLVRYWTEKHAHVTGWSFGARLVSQQLAIPAPWLTGHQGPPSFGGGVDPRWEFPSALALLAVATVWAVRRRDRQALRLDAIAGSLIAAAVVSASNIVDAPFDYLVRWIWIVGAVAWLAIGWTALRAVADLVPEDRVLRPASWVVIFTVVGASSVGAVLTTLPLRSSQRWLTHLAGPARHALRRLPGPILVSSPGDLPSTLAVPGIVLLGVHAGVDARMGPGAAKAVGATHTISETQARSVVVVALDHAIDDYAGDASYLQLVSYDPLSQQERAYHNRMEIAMRRAFLSGRPAIAAFDTSHRQDEMRLQQLDRRGARVAVFLKTGPTRA